MGLMYARAWAPPVAWGIRATQPAGDELRRRTGKRRRTDRETPRACVEEYEYRESETQVSCVVSSHAVMQHKLLIITKLGGWG